MGKELTDWSEWLGSALVTTVILFCLDATLCATLILSMQSDREWIIALFGLTFGLLVGQPVLAALWLTFSTNRLSLRLPISVAIVLLVLFAWFAGMRAADELVAVEFSLIVGAFCYLLFGALALPFWILQRYSQRRAMLWFEPAPTVEKEQFSVRYILVVTAGVGALVTIGRLIFWDESWSGSLAIDWRVIRRVSQMVLTLGAYVAIIAGSLLWLVLVEDSRNLVWAGVIATALVAFPYLIIQSFSTFAGPPPANFYYWFTLAGILFGIGVLVVTSIGLAIAHSYGYRLLPTHRAIAEGTQVLPEPNR